MITRDQVTFVEGFHSDGDPYTDVVLAKDGAEIGTIWPVDMGGHTYFDHESAFTGMSWSCDNFEGAVQMLIDVANETLEP